VVLGVSVFTQDLADPQPSVVPGIDRVHDRRLAIVVQRAPVGLSNAHESSQAPRIFCSQGSSRVWVAHNEVVLRPLKEGALVEPPHFAVFLQ
jgi:hypothetical protein